MKTIKVKVQPTPETLIKYEKICKELEWLWNYVRAVALHNHCLEWYEWAEGKGADVLEWPLWAKEKGADLSGCIKTPLRFSKSGGWIGAACQIAKGGPYFKKSDKAPLIHYGDGKTKQGYELVAGDKPYEPIKPKRHRYREVSYSSKGTSITRSSKSTSITRELKGKGWGLDNMALLNASRSSQGLDELTCHSDFVGGLLADFEVAWKAYLDGKLLARKQPKYKDGKQRKISTLNNNQKTIPFKKGQFNGQGLVLEPCDRSYKKRLEGYVTKTYKLTLKPSGFYLCLIAQSEAEEENRLKLKQQEKALSSIKKKVLDSIKGKKEQTKALANSEEYQAALAKKKSIENELPYLLIEDSKCAKRTGHIAGIDPGIKAIVATDEGHLFNPNESRERIQNHIEKLQSKLDIMTEKNDKRLDQIWKRGQREATNNEQKLRDKISRLHERAANSSNAFNHKLSTRLARTYDVIAWEATALTNMGRQTTPKLAEDGSYYEQNGRAAKAGLNRSLKTACMGDLRAKTKSKLKEAGKTYTEAEARYSSQRCHCCGEKGIRPIQDTFICLNKQCDLFNEKQNADTNAAKNHKNNGLKILKAG